MSNAPTGLGYEFKPEKMSNIVLGIKDWCAYTGDCYIHLNLKNLCNNCIWQEEFDIPEIIQGERKKWQ